MLDKDQEPRGPLSPLQIFFWVGGFWLVFKLVLEAIIPFEVQYKTAETAIAKAWLVIDLVTLMPIAGVTGDMGRWGFTIAGAIVQAAVISCVIYFISWAMARQRLKKWNQRLKDKLCPRCGYDLRAGGEDCPECGWQKKKEPEDRSDRLWRF
ncbi:MAG: zinc ribbon domain-containing protein [Phycisphaeraceae bacterium]